MQFNYQIISAKNPPNNQTTHDARKPNANGKRWIIATLTILLNKLNHKYSSSYEKQSKELNKQGLSFTYMNHPPGGGHKRI